MRERPIENERKERNCYGTPQWVTLALIPHLRSIEGTVWDPVEGAGSRTMLQLLTDSGFKVEAPDIAADPRDFLRRSAVSCGAIITNPPHAYAQEFIEHGLRLMRPNDGLVAMLLRTDYDHASSRQYLFGRHKHFAKKLVLTKRIKWFEDTTGQPPFKHAWFIWDWNTAVRPCWPMHEFTAACPPRTCERKRDTFRMNSSVKKESVSSARTHSVETAVSLIA